MNRTNTVLSPTTKHASFLPPPPPPIHPPPLSLTSSIRYWSIFISTVHRRTYPSVSLFPERYFPSWLSLETPRPILHISAPPQILAWHIPLLLRANILLTKVRNNSSPIYLLALSFSYCLCFSPTHCPSSPCCLCPTFPLSLLDAAFSFSWPFPNLYHSVSPYSSSFISLVVLTHTFPFIFPYNFLYIFPIHPFSSPTNIYTHSLSRSWSRSLSLSRHPSAPAPAHEITLA